MKIVGVGSRIYIRRYASVTAKNMVNVVIGTAIEELLMSRTRANCRMLLVEDQPGWGLLQNYLIKICIHEKNYKLIAYFMDDWRAYVLVSWSIEQSYFYNFRSNKVTQFKIKSMDEADKWVLNSWTLISIEVKLCHLKSNWIKAASLYRNSIKMMKLWFR